MMVRLFKKPAGKKISLLAKNKIMFTILRYVSISIIYTQAKVCYSEKDLEYFLHGSGFGNTYPWSIPLWDISYSKNLILGVQNLNERVNLLDGGVGALAPLAYYSLLLATGHLSCIHIYEVLSKLKQLSRERI